MADLSKNDTWLDPSKKAENILDYVLEDSSIESIGKKESQSSVEESESAIRSYSQASA